MPVLMLWSGIAWATTLEELLARGPVSVVETHDDGRLEQITVYASVAAPLDEVWARLVDFGAYPGWMPQVVSADVLARTDTHADVAWAIKVPGPNFKFTAAYEIDVATHTVVATGTAGGLDGGKWAWKLTPSGSGTLVERTTFSSAVIDNWLVRQFDDDQHSLELGLNAASPLLEVRGLVAAAEKR